MTADTPIAQTAVEQKGNFLISYIYCLYLQTCLKKVNVVVDIVAIIAKYMIFLLFLVIIAAMSAIIKKFMKLLQIIADISLCFLNNSSHLCYKCI